jgi:hypothetical protein
MISSSAHRALFGTKTATCTASPSWGLERGGWGKKTAWLTSPSSVRVGAILVDLTCSRIDLRACRRAKSCGMVARTPSASAKRPPGCLLRLRLVDRKGDADVLVRPSLTYFGPVLGFAFQSKVWSSASTKVKTAFRLILSSVLILTRTGLGTSRIATTGRMPTASPASPKRT